MPENVVTCGNTVRPTFGAKSGLKLPGSRSRVLESPYMRYCSGTDFSSGYSLPLTIIDMFSPDKLLERK